jgi:signal transduction histidine kinase
MSQLGLASLNAAEPLRWAHDIRNALATVGLHLETLERLSGSRGREIAHAAHLLMSRAAAMCNAAMMQDQAEAASRRRPLDIVQTVVQIANLLRPTAPEGFEIRVAGSGGFTVLADPQDVFRILFNLVHNAIAVARRQADKRMTHVTLLVEREASAVTVRIADDGPGLPKTVRTNMFRRQQSTTGGSGIGLAIARELAERNGGVLRYAASARGTTFVLELPAPAAGAPKDAGALRSLGKRVEH